eukprot:scaffold118008_cov63-Phaeocystis_antarctica.AAC.2
MASTASAVQVDEPIRCPRSVSSIRWTITRPARPMMQIARVLLERVQRNGALNADQAVTTSMRAIRKAWHRNARRKNCAAKADSWAGSAKAPVIGCIAMVTAAAASRSGSCALPRASRARSPGTERGILASWVLPEMRLHGDGSVVQDLFWASLQPSVYLRLHTSSGSSRAEPISHRFERQRGVQRYVPVHHVHDKNT